MNGPCLSNVVRVKGYATPGEPGLHVQVLTNGASKDLILSHTVQLKPLIKAHSSGRMVSSGISDVVITSVHSESTSDFSLLSSNRKEQALSSLISFCIIIELVSFRLIFFVLVFFFRSV